MRPIELDERLSLALALYTPCDRGADIGTDHGRLPCRLLEDGVCREMIVSDISAKALRNARELVEKRGLTERAHLRVADGLDAVDAPCGCVSVMGMGGRTIAQMLRRGRDRLSGADLVLSAHTELPEVREALVDIGYHLTAERLCRAANRWYVFLKAAPGKAAYTAVELATGPLLLAPGEDVARYAAWRARVLRAKLAGLRSAEEPNEREIAAAEEIIARYAARAEEDGLC